MTRRKKIVLAALATVAATAAVLLTNLHWKLYGLVRGEPFYKGSSTDADFEEPPWG